MSDSFKITIHMVSSLDGMVAKKDNSISWLETSDNFEKGKTVTHQDTVEFLKTIDCYIMGSRTYEHAIDLSKSYGWAYGDIPTFVVSKRTLLVDRPNVEIYSGDLTRLVEEKLKPGYKNVWLVGGPKLAKTFITLKLANEIRISILPIILGEGTVFFDQIGKEHALHLKDVTTFKNGMVEIWYEIEY